MAVVAAAWLLPATAAAQEADEPEPEVMDVGEEAEPALADEGAGAGAETDVGIGAGVEAEAGAGAQADMGTEATETAPADPEPVAAPMEGETEYEVETETETEVETEGDLGSLVLAAEVGGILPFSELGPHVAIGLEVGYLLPVLDRRLEVFAAASWSPPMNDFEDDIGGTSYDGEITEQALSISLGPRFRFLEVGEMFNVTAAAGPRLYMLRSESNGSSNASDESFAEFTEESIEIGVFAAIGAELVLGPGALFLDVDFGWSDLSHRISGDVNTTNVTATVGYRLFVL